MSLLPALATHDVGLLYFSPYLPPSHPVCCPGTQQVALDISIWPLEFLRSHPPGFPSLTCMCCRHASQDTGSDRACTQVGCRTRCNGVEPLQSAWSRPSDYTRAREGQETLSGPGPRESEIPFPLRLATMRPTHPGNGDLTF